MSLHMSSKILRLKRYPELDLDVLKPVGSLPRPFSRPGIVFQKKGPRNNTNDIAPRRAIASRLKALVLEGLAGERAELSGRFTAKDDPETGSRSARCPYAIALSRTVPGLAPTAECVIIVGRVFRIPLITDQGCR
jgi:hypothetical protein